MLKKISLDMVPLTFANEKPGTTCYCILDKEYVFHGNSSQKKYKINAMNRMGLKRLPLIVPGGCVVLQENDIILYHYTTQPDDFFRIWSIYLMNFLKERHIKAFIGHELNAKHHDLLIKGKDHTYKFGTHSENEAWPGLYFSCCGIAFHVKTNHIRKITAVSETKVPRGLSSWGIKTEEIEQLFLKFMKEVYNEELK